MTPRTKEPPDDRQPNDPMEMMPTVQAYTVEQVAKMLNVSRDKVYYLLRTRQLRSIKIGNYADGALMPSLVTVPVACGNSVQDHSA